MAQQHQQLGINNPYATATPPAAITAPPSHPTLQRLPSDEEPSRSYATEETLASVMMASATGAAGRASPSAVAAPVRSSPQLQEQQQQQQQQMRYAEWSSSGSSSASSPQQHQPAAEHQHQEGMDAQRSHYSAAQQQQLQYDDAPVEDVYGGQDSGTSSSGIIVEQEEYDEHEDAQEDGDVDDGASDSASSVPDEDIDFGLTYALHTFVATVEGQASVLKGDSLVLLDDANSYWWLVRVLKTEEVGYIPAENIETPWERLARLNKHRNVDLAAPRPDEHHHPQHVVDAAAGSAFGSPNSQQQQQHHQFGSPGTVGKHQFASPVARLGSQYSEDYDQEEAARSPSWENDVAAAAPASGSRSRDRLQHQQSLEQEEQGPASESRRVFFAPPTYVDHPGQTWSDSSSGSGGSGDEGDAEDEREQGDVDDGEMEAEEELDAVEGQVAAQQSSLMAEPDDGMAWDDRAVQEQRRQQDQQLLSPTSLSAPQGSGSSESLLQQLESGETRRITATPSVAQDTAGDAEVDHRRLPSAAASREASQPRKVSTGSNISVATQSSVGSTMSSGSPEHAITTKRSRESIGADGGDDGKKKRSGVFSGLFRKKDKKSASKGVSSLASPSGGNDSDSFIGRSSDDSTLFRTSVDHQPPPQIASSSPHIAETPASPGMSPHGMRVHQIDQRQQQLYHQYMARSGSNPTLEPAARSYGTQAAATQRLSGGGRPSSVLISPNAGTMGGSGMGAIQATLSVVRVFAGNDLPAEASFKTVLLNNSTSTADLVRQALQRFHIAQGEGYYLSIKEVDGDEVELADDAKPLETFERMCKEAGAEAAAQVRRASVGSISSVSSALSLNPAIAKLGMNDFSDDSLVKIYLHKRGLQIRVPEPSTANGAMSPSLRFTVRIGIEAESLPESLAFDPNSEAVLPRDAVQSSAAGRVSMTSRWRSLSMAKSATVGEAIEAGIERFGIAEGVIDGGDDVEEKAHPRKAVSKMRYVLVARHPSGENVRLSPGQRLVDVYRTPPLFKTVDRRASRDASAADARSEDPVFVLTRVSPTTAEIIQRQRAELRANQNAIISAQANAERGVDVVLADRTMLRSSRIFAEGGEEQVRYSYISSDGETFDVSQYVHEEWIENEVETLAAPPALERQATDTSVYVTAPSTPLEAPDLLASADPRRVQRVVDRVRKRKSDDTLRATSPNLETIPEQIRGDVEASRTPPPVTIRHRQQPSIASIMSVTQPLLPRPVRSEVVRPQRPIPIDNDFGIPTMMGVIAARAEKYRAQVAPTKLTPTERRWFGPDVDCSKLPPRLRRHIEPTQERIQRLDAEIDDLIAQLR